MNFEVMCFGWTGDSLRVVQKEYFDTYAEARAFEKSDEAKRYDGVSITPMNYEAELEIRSATH